MSRRARAEKGMKVECPKCGRWVGYWPDKLDYHVAHLMPHNLDSLGRRRMPRCEGQVYVG